MIRLAILVSIVMVAATVLGQERSAPNKINLIVVDKENRALDDIRQEEITLTENGKPQSIISFSRNVDPVDYCLVIDASGSFRNLLPAGLDVAKAIVSGNRQTDRTCLVRFVSSDKIKLIDELTSDKTTLINDLGGIKPEEGQSAVVDAVYSSAKHLVELSRDPARRRALVLITDGEDRASYYTEKKLLELLAGHDVQVFAIGVVSLLANEMTFARPTIRTRAEELLKQLAKETGGRTFFAKSGKQIAEAGEHIVRDLHTQYTVSYGPSDADGKKGFREITVRVANSTNGIKRTAITRHRYLIPQQWK